MRVGILTSWRVPCGVYQYSARLADGLAAAGHEPVILAGRADEHRSVAEESEYEVHDVATIGHWRDDGTHSLDVPFICSLELGAIHVQYQSMLFTQPDLLALSRRMREVFPERSLAITFHDNCQRPDFPYGAFDLRFSHRWNVGPPDVEVIPFGIEDRPAVVRTFGLGRSRADLIAPICDRRGWVFESAASHETIRGGGQAWRSHEELIAWLREADAIVLWYDDVGAAGSSQAARTAMASRRPVITNDTTWFSDLPPRVDGYSKVSNEAQLERELEAVLARPYVWENSWESVARLLVDRYAGVGVPA